MIRWLWILLALWPGLSQAACRQALVLALDVSGSVDAREYALQRDGLAAALGSDAVRQALLESGNAPVRLTIFEWSGPDDQAMILPWVAITDDLVLAGIIARIRAHQRQPQTPTTAIGAALETGFALLAEQPDCWKHTLDISGDGEANTGPRPQSVPFGNAPAGSIVNGLVIDDGLGGSLQGYFLRYVTRGPDAFVETARGFEDYASTMERKLLRELQAIAIGSARHP